MLVPQAGGFQHSGAGRLDLPPHPQSGRGSRPTVQDPCGSRSIQRWPCSPHFMNKRRRASPILLPVASRMAREATNSRPRACSLPLAFGSPPRRPPSPYRHAPQQSSSAAYPAECKPRGLRRHVLPSAPLWAAGSSSRARLPCPPRWLLTARAQGPGPPPTTSSKPPTTPQRTRKSRRTPRPLVWTLHELRARPGGERGMPVSRRPSPEFRGGECPSPRGPWSPPRTSSSLR